jgi:hypothetical protein
MKFKLNSYKKIFTIILLTVVLACASVTNIFAQNDEVIIEGNPSLTQSELDKSVRFLEKILGANSVESATIRYFAGHDAEKGKSGVIQSLKEFAALENKVQKANDTQIKEVRESLVAKMRDADDSEVFSYLVEIYDQSDKKTSETSSANFQTESEGAVFKNGGTISDLVGKWEKKSSGMSSYSGGVYQGSSGNYESYEFFADGRVNYTTLIAVQNYGCRLEAFAQSKGRAIASGTTLNLKLAAGTIRREDSCSPAKNYTKPTNATDDNYNWRIEKDKYGTIQLALTGADGRTFYYRRAK